MQSCIYLDNNATTKVDPAVIETMLPYLKEYYGNPSSMHTFGGQVGKAVKEAREQVAALLGAETSEIVFTSCGSEGNNTAIRQTPYRYNSGRTSSGLECLQAARKTRLHGNLPVSER
jgi:cysteine sulfinate desulfinase/cysteine desulfurase-like protein